jgi:diguanylate cyclase (GGDEF)-like protein
MSNTPATKLEITELADFLARADAAAGRPGEGRAVLVAADHRPLAVAVADLDRFQEVNDAYGTEVGDRVLATFERTLAGSLQADAVIARIGGDEYAVALPGTSAESALVQLEEVRSHYASHGVAGVEEPLDASFGVAARPPHAEGTAEVLRCAAEALMRAKREGSARTVIYVEEKMTMKSNYYSRASLDRLAKLAATTSRTEASLLREALDDLFVKHRDKL